MRTPEIKILERVGDSALGHSALGRRATLAQATGLGRGGSSRMGLVVITSAFSAMLLSANLATPLYAVWAKQFGYSTAVLALVFAVYALVLIPALMVFGQLSDQLGRRVVIAIGLSLDVIASLLFALATGTAWLFAARATLGVAQGVLSGAATAALAELVPSGRARRAATLATLSQAGGTAFGVLLCGVLAQWGPAPEVLPFVAGMIICTVVAVALPLVPETAECQPGRLRIRRPQVPREIRGAFARVGLTAAAVWAVAGLFLAVMPSYAGTLVLHTQNLALLALVAALVLLSSCAAQLVARRGAPPAPAQATGLTLLAVGLLLLVLAAPTRSDGFLGDGLLVAGAIVAGAGHGVAALAAQDDLTRIAPDHQRGEVSAAFYVCIYLGVSVPIIGIGVLAVTTTLYTAIAAFAAVTGVGALAIAAWHLRQHLRSVRSAAS